MHIFMTGATGRIGRAVLTCALEAQHDVTALARADISAAALHACEAEVLRGDLANPDVWMAQASTADVFIHLASTSDDQMHTLEPALLKCLLRHAAARATPLRVLYTGSCWVYGDTASAVAQETSPRSTPAFLDWVEQGISILQDQPGLSLAMIHPAMVYDETGGSFARMLTALRAGRPAPIWGAERTRWPLVHTSDAARAYLLLAENHSATGTFHLVTEEGIETGEIARVLCEQAGIKTRPAVLPRKWALMRHGPWAEGPMLDQQMRDTRLAALGWVPQIRDFSTLQYDL